MSTYHVCVESCKRLCVGYLKQRGISRVAQDFERWDAFDFMVVVEYDYGTGSIRREHLNVGGASYEVVVQLVGGIARCCCECKMHEYERCQMPKHVGVNRLCVLTVNMMANGSI